MDFHVVLVILNLIIIESLLSVDNASALAAMVQHLPDGQRQKALRYGLVGAYVFRGACLLAASWLIKILWLKIAGGLYLLYLAYKHFYQGDGDEATKTSNKGFWATVISVEILDLSLSIDNIFAAVALSKEFWVVMVGVGIGILAMRFVAGWFVNLIEKYPSLTNSAFIVIALLGFKLILGGIVDYVPSWITLKNIIESHIFDLAFSVCMMIIFFYPLAFNKKKAPERVLLVEERDPTIIDR
jgi:YkoY family integral membrane protein